MPIKHTTLSIAGFDGSGGAGIQADLKTFSALGCYGMTVLTALPIQNTCGVSACFDLPLDAISAQLSSIFNDIMPDSIKIGMLHSAEIVQLVADTIKARGGTTPVVLDPVLVAKSGDPLLQPDALKVLKEELIPLVSLITPNLPEAEALIGHTISDAAEMPELAKALLNLGSGYVLLKGGHLDGKESNDLLLHEEEILWLKSPRIDSKNTHGTGCTLSAAIAAFLARGYSMTKACKEAKKYIYQAIEAAAVISVGKGRGPVHHFYEWW